MKKNNGNVTKNFKAIIIFIYLCIGGIFTLIIPKEVNFEFLVEYIIILSSYYLVTGFWILNILKNGIYIFEPAPLVIVLTIVTYSIQPLISMVIDDIDLMGFYVFDGAIKATIIYVFSMFVFISIYYNNIKTEINSKKYSYNKAKYEVASNEKKAIIKISYICVIVGVLVSLIDLLKQGYGLQYILSLGLTGTRKELDDSVGVFINLRYLMIPGFLYLDKYAKNKWPNNILRFIAIACLFIRNKRWIIVIIIVSPIVYYYIKDKKSPKGRLIFQCGILISIILGAMQFMRGKSGGITSIEWSSFGLADIWKAYSGNFDLYKTLYAAVTYFPMKHQYIFGQQMIFLTIATCIPRSIWATKPSSLIMDLKGDFMGSGSVHGAWAISQLTEFYVEFGIVGVILCMGIFALICRRLKKLYLKKNSVDNLVLYSVMFPMLMQLVIRGYMPINFWAIFFMVLPIFLIKLITKKKYTV